MRILLVEDDSQTQQLLKATLTEQNFLVDVASDGETAWELQQQFVYDLLLLDVMLPNLDGISLCQRLRQAKQTVLIMLLTARSGLLDKLQGLESGADDYLVKPVHPQELVARIRTLLRRRLAADPLLLSYDRLSLNPVSREVTYDGQLLKIGRKEYLILELLLRNPTQVYSRYDIVDRLWSLDEELPTEATVKSHIRSIRRKLEQVGAGDIIETLYGHGYRLNPALLKPPTPPLSAPVVEQVNCLTAQFWQRAYVKSLNKVTELEQAIAAIQAGTFGESLHQQAIFTAHKLAGSLSVFGFEVAAQLAQKIEDTLRQASVPVSAVPQLRQWTQVLRLELDGQQSSIPQIQQLSPLIPAPSPIPSGLDNTRILVLDDDSTILSQVTSILSSHGMHVHALTEACDLRAMIEQVEPDLLIIDILMPDINGLVLCQQLRQHSQGKTLPILVFSSRSDRETVNQVFAAGADDYIPKPIVAHELITRITNRLSRHRLLNACSINSNNHQTMSN